MSIYIFETKKMSICLFGTLSHQRKTYTMILVSDMHICFFESFFGLTKNQCVYHENKNLCIYKFVWTAMFFTSILVQVKEEKEVEVKTPQQLYVQSLQKQVAASTQKAAASAASEMEAAAAASSREVQGEKDLFALRAELHSRLPKLKEMGATLASEEATLRRNVAEVQGKLADCEGWQTKVSETMCTMSARLELRENPEERATLTEFQEWDGRLKVEHKNLENVLASEEMAERSLANRKNKLLEDEEQYMQMHAEHAKLNDEVAARKKADLLAVNKLEVLQGQYKKKEMQAQEKRQEEIDNQRDEEFQRQEKEKEWLAEMQQQQQERFAQQQRIAQQQHLAEMAKIEEMHQQQQQRFAEQEEQRLAEMAEIQRKQQLVAEQQRQAEMAEIQQQQQRFAEQQRQAEMVQQRFAEQQRQAEMAEFEQQQQQRFAEQQRLAEMAELQHQQHQRQQHAEMAEMQLQQQQRLAEQQRHTEMAGIQQQEQQSFAEQHHHAEMAELQQQQPDQQTFLRQMLLEEETKSQRLQQLLREEIAEQAAEHRIALQAQQAQLQEQEQARSKQETMLQQERERRHQLLAELKAAAETKDKQLPEMPGSPPWKKPRTYETTSLRGAGSQHKFPAAYPYQAPASASSQPVLPPPLVQPLPVGLVQSGLWLTQPSQPGLLTRQPVPEAAQPPATPPTFRPPTSKAPPPSPSPTEIPIPVAVPNVPLEPEDPVLEAPAPPVAASTPKAPPAAPTPRTPREQQLGIASVNFCLDIRFVKTNLLNYMRYIATRI